MLDSQTKKRIDDCRDILVGKLPDPKAQIEQITIGLIYKFMDDMDKEAIELGGNVKFFADYKIPDPEFPNDRKQDKLIEFSKYRWDKLFDSKVTATEMLQLYSEAITGMDKNPNIPSLFRDIFKNAYLPYRDPETLKMFLKTINEFEYSHSEKLGDAFEYLLSVMGSQGDAGQFRTPRHIIDFVTACVNPQKHETVLDPACGTAGFLLSAYKHIINYELKNTKNEEPVIELTPDERKRLAQNIVGYDISPDMVRLSLVNMYLHGFATPLIHEYDSLSSEERWNETYDVILANPPFMTPKGGIRPHKRFGVQANKAEVLFTDYIAEHLNPNGRAGIVVPNGIVATSQTAYKQLRKMLVQDSLIAVISLPAGVFQPYSGVKTSVLILDKRLAKKSQHILFLKIENDGFDLGAQRREIDKNDLPLALQTLEAYKNHLAVTSSEVEKQSEVENDKAFEDLPSLATLVEKEIILANKDVVLNTDRYLENLKSLTEYPTISIIDCIDNVTYSNKILKQNFLEKGKYPIVDQSENFIAGYWNEKTDVFKIIKPVVVFGDHTRIFKYIDFDFVLGADGVKILQPIDEINPKYFYYILQSLEIKNLGYSRHFKELKDLEIPLPPIEIQQQIVSEIEGYQKIIDGAKQIVNNYKPTISINPDWEMVELGTLAKIKGGYAFKSDEFVDSGIQVLKISNVATGRLVLDKNPAFIQLSKKEDFLKYLIKKGDILITMTGTEGKRDYGDVCFIKNDGEYLLNQRVGKVELNSQEVIREYLAFAMMSPIYQDEIFRKATGVRQSNVSGTDLEEIRIPLPTITEQQTIVKAIEEEMQLVNSNKRLIAIFEQKIKTKIGEVWGVKKEEEPELLIAAEPEVEYLKSGV